MIQLGDYLIASPDALEKRPLLKDEMVRRLDTLARDYGKSIDPSTLRWGIAGHELQEGLDPKREVVLWCKADTF